jgi:hypothetical protein
LLPDSCFFLFLFPYSSTDSPDTFRAFLFSQERKDFLMFNNRGTDAAHDFNRAQLLAINWAGRGATNVTITYSAYGDSGDINTITILPRSLTPILQTEQLMQRRVHWHFVDGQDQSSTVEKASRRKSS